MPAMRRTGLCLHAHPCALPEPLPDLNTSSCPRSKSPGCEGSCTRWLLPRVPCSASETRALPSAGASPAPSSPLVHTATVYHSSGATRSAAAAGDCGSGCGAGACSAVPTSSRITRLQGVEVGVGCLWCAWRAPAASTAAHTEDAATQGVPSSLCPAAPCPTHPLTRRPDAPPASGRRGSGSSAGRRRPGAAPAPPPGTRRARRRRCCGTRGPAGWAGGWGHAWKGAE